MKQQMESSERRLLEALDTALQSAEVRVRIDVIVEQVAMKLPQDHAAKMAWEPVPLSVFDRSLPPSIQSSWVFILRAGAGTGAERHPNSHQRMMSYRGFGDLQTGGDSQWQSNLLRSECDARLEERWVSVSPNVWHQAVVSTVNWVVVSFHTVSASDLIEERPDPDDESKTRQRQYLTETESG